MDRKRMLFCPDLGEGLTTKALSDLLAKKVFGDQGFAKLLKARYDQMGELFKDASYDNPCWNLIEHGCKNCATANKRDARLKVPRGKIACNGNNANVTRLFDYDNFGHDMPVWVTYNNDPKAKRVMIVSQDPKRDNDVRENIYLSTPFGIHSKDFECHGMDPRVRDMLNAFLEADYLVYMTDYMKFYAKERGFIKGKVMRRNDPDGFRAMFSDSLEYEIKEMVKPSFIIFLGADFTNPHYASLPFSPQVKRDRIEEGEVGWNDSRYRAIVTCHTNARFVRTEDNPHPAITHFDNIVKMVLEYLSTSVA